jgi:UDP-3-O-[3-hydroxymyristoyl] glucosamine N-acyltransferase
MASSLTIAELAELVGAEIWGLPGTSVPCEQRIDAVAGLEEADSGSVSFLGNPRYAVAAQQSEAGVILVTREAATQLRFRPGVTLLVVEDPSAAFQHVALWFLAALKRPSGFVGIHPTAVVHPTAILEEEVTLCPYVVVDADVRIGAGSWIGPHVSIGAGSKVGQDCHLHAHSVVREGVEIGDRVILQPGAVVGSCGFGYLPNPDGSHRKVEHLGGVELQDDVEIGANTCVDRARFRRTVIGVGSKLDNLVQIGHNVRLGAHNLVVSQVGIAGSSSTGSHCVMGGQAAIVGHVHLGDHVQLTARAAATKNLTAGPYSGAPAVPYKEGMRLAAAQRMIPKLQERIRGVEKSLEELLSNKS